MIPILLALAALWSAGCGSVFPKSQPSRFFALSPLSQAADSTEHSRQISLGIGPVRLPGYLDRQEIMTRVAPNRFVALEYDRWAEPLDENFTHVLAQNLSTLLGTDQILAYPWPPDKKPRYRVEIQVLRFEYNSAREAELWARWTVIDVSGKENPSSKESRLTRAATENSVDGSVAALSETVGDLSREIARTVITIAGQREP